MINPYLILAILLAFIASILLVFGGGEWAAGRLSQEKGVYEKFVGKKLRRLFKPVTPQEFVIGHILFMLVAILVAALVTESFIAGLVLGVLMGIFLPNVYLNREWKKRIVMLDEQIEEAMVFMANSFKANPSLPEAVQDVCNSMDAPIAQEFAVMIREYKLGTPLNQSMINMQQRVPSRNMQLAVSALLIGRSVGGDIPSVLEDIANTIRESYRLERVIDAQTAQGRMQAWVMGAAPAVVCLVFYLMDPVMMYPVFNTFIGYMILSVATVLNIVGVALILKIINIDV